MIEVSGQPVAPENLTHTADGFEHSDLGARVIFQDREANIWVRYQHRSGPLQSQQIVVPLVSLPQLP